MPKKSKPKNFFDTIGRSSGILLHPTSLPGKYGIGELGKDAFKFVDLLKKYKQKFWQILPLGPTGYGNSPYQCFSAFAGNPLLISIESLLSANLLKENDIKNIPKKDQNRVDFGSLIPWKWNLLEKAFDTFNTNTKHPYHKKFRLFQKKHHYWLHDYALFMAIKHSLDNKPWNEWPKNLRDREPETLLEWQQKNLQDYLFHTFVQFLFFDQWNALKSYCKRNKVLIIGDIPIFVAMDSADVWANRNLFYLDEEGQPEVIAGVPPDYFSETGQRWGNPLYKWQEHKKHSYNWWKARFKHMIQIVDVVRVDHFRGFEAYWEIQASEETAINGKWIKGPRSDLFDDLRKDIKNLPVIAENLGIITAEVEELRNKYSFPGMYILQFAFDDKYNSTNPYLPHNYSINNVVYTGTHDNDTLVGWFENLKPAKLKLLQDYFMDPLDDIVDVFIRETIKSVALISIIPLQDVLRINNSGRMNFPGQESNNWEWRFDWDLLNESYFKELESYLKLFNRLA